MIKRPTVAVVNTRNLEHNYAQIRGRIEGTTGMMAVVKANAYGHGEVEVAQVLERAGCEQFGVVIVEEGVRLRSAGIKRPIVVLGGVYPDELDEVFEFDLTPVVFDLVSARALDLAAKSQGVLKKVHVKVDTGMGRLGLLPDRVRPFFEAFKAFDNLVLDGLLSHFAVTEDEDKPFFRGQLLSFSEAVGTALELGFTPAFTHMANSAAAVDFTGAHFNMIRPGIMLYGSYPAVRFKERIELRPVMELKTRLVQIKRVPRGSSVSYGRTFTAERESVIGTIPMGYADGLPRSLSGVGRALVRGRRVPMVGAVCMDMTVLDLTGVEGVNVGDEVVLIGTQNDETITVEEVAERAGTISYEILCNIGPRVPRVYPYLNT